MLYQTLDLYKQPVCILQEHFSETSTAKQHDFLKDKGYFSVFKLLTLNKPPRKKSTNKYMTIKN